MTSILDTVIPKSDQMNFDDFIGGQTKTIKITQVKKVGGDQPVFIHYENDNGKPWKPCKSMRRVMIRCWTDEIENWIGKSVTLFGDPKVRFGGKEEGGIRISHASHISNEITMALTETRANRKPFTVKPLVIAEPAPAQIDHTLEILKRNARDNAINGTSALQAWWGTMPKESQAKLKPFMDEYKKIASEHEPKEETTNEGVTA